MTKHAVRAASGRLARRNGSQSTNPTRLALIDSILDESSSILLNDGTKQPSSREALDAHVKLLDLIQELNDVEMDCNPKLPSRDELAWKNFFRWVDQELGGDERAGQAKIFEKVYVKQLDSCNDECALVSKDKFVKGQNILAIPRKLMLSTETVANDIDLFEFIRKDSIASAMQNVVLVLHLLNEYCKGEKSSWYHYLQILPDRILPVLTLNRQNLECLLPSAHMCEVLKMIRAIARQYSYFFGCLKDANLPLSKNFTYKFYCWGVSVVCSRQNEIPPSSKRLNPLPIHALIPVLDMCNHDVKSSQATFEDDESRLVASKDLDVGDEVTINYGCRSSGDFYIHNGFVPDCLPYDMLPLTIKLNPKDRLFALKAKLLRTLNMPSLGKFRLNYNNHDNRHKRDPHLTMFLIIYSLLQNEIELIMDDDNPVGVADEIYEFVQYQCTLKNQGSHDDGIQTKFTTVRENQSEIDEMKERLSKSVQDYLSKRSAITITLIDRTLAEKKDFLDVNLVKLLKHERSIYESYIMNSSE